MAKSIDRVGMAIENSTKVKLIASPVSFQFKIIEALPLSNEERGLKPLLKRAMKQRSLNWQYINSCRPGVRACRFLEVLFHFRGYRTWSCLIDYYVTVRESVIYYVTRFCGTLDGDLEAGRSSKL